MRKLLNEEKRYGDVQDVREIKDPTKRALLMSAVESFHEFCTDVSHEEIAAKSEIDPETVWRSLYVAGFMAAINAIKNA